MSRQTQKAESSVLRVPARGMEHGVNMLEPRAIGGIYSTWHHIFSCETLLSLGTWLANAFTITGSPDTIPDHGVKHASFHDARVIDLHNSTELSQASPSPILHRLAA